MLELGIGADERIGGTVGSGFCTLDGALIGTAPGVIGRFAALFAAPVPCGACDHDNPLGF